MVQTIKYEVVKKIGEIEIRHYPRTIIARVNNSERDSFGVLFRFISGENIQKKKVKMTSPVVSQETSQEIKMTSPVLTDFSNQGYMAFVMPEDFDLESTPKPLDSRVEIVEIPERNLAVLRFSGSWSEDRFEEKKRKLIEALANAKIKSKGNIFTMLYNPPFTPSFLRRNEVAIEIQPD